ncbi:Dna2/Cas4 domain-containing protein [Methanothermobacter thermautotrophicus]|uniref:Dna2/Cas4 domain-containing protein n=1 Tax=Methanothermobacter thermautotrophicus TaxID=145262 RepID=A0A842YMK6_METTF|nr:Dna2/Cas4 domain-containing protein [Methanothermobacter thermautotrophicus]MBE2900168.1 Dna2/Cas4 domain-containing protein [Methanothermobacter thermautotrophicus]
MSVAVSMISEFMFCPIKLYLREVLGVREPMKPYAVNLRKVYLDFRAAAESRTRKLEDDVGVEELEAMLMEDLERILGDLDEDERDPIAEPMLFEVRAMALRIGRSMALLRGQCDRAASLIFPPLIRDYPIYDPSIELHGRVSMEISGGSYYPLKFRTSLPPASGVWPSDSLEITAHAILVEREFETEVMVAFIDYMLPAERRPVVIDYRRREYLFDVLDEIRRITDDGEVPSVDVNPSRCAGCSLAEVCAREGPC